MWPHRRLLPRPLSPASRRRRHRRFSPTWRSMQEGRPPTDDRFRDHRPRRVVVDATSTVPPPPSIQCERDVPPTSIDAAAAVPFAGRATVTTAAIALQLPPSCCCKAAAAAATTVPSRHCSASAASAAAKLPPLPPPPQPPPHAAATRHCRLAAAALLPPPPHAATTRHCRLAKLPPRRRQAAAAAARRHRRHPFFVPIRVIRMAASVAWPRRGEEGIGSQCWHFTEGGVVGVRHTKN